MAGPKRPFQKLQGSLQRKSQWQRWPEQALPFLFVPSITINTGNDRSSLPRYIEEDGGGRASIHCSVVDSSKHDDGRSGIKAKCGRDKKGDSSDRSDSREHTDDGSYDATDQTIKKVLDRSGDSKTMDQMLERFKHLFILSLSLNLNLNLVMAFSSLSQP